METARGRTLKTAPGHLPAFEAALNTNQPLGAGRILAPTLLLLFAASVGIGLFSMLYQPAYTVGDWLINYSDGFVRRGLPGQIFLTVAHLIHVPVPWVALGSAMLLYVVFLAGVYVLARPLRVNALWCALLFSPAALPFVVLNGLHDGYRKETLLFAALVVTIILLQRGISDAILRVYLLVAFAAIILSHEAMAICLPYFFAAVMLERRSLARSVRVTAPAFLLAAALVVLVGRHAGTMEAAQAICSSVGGQWPNLPPGTFPGMDWSHYGLCSGSVAWLSVSLNGFHQQMAGARSHLLRSFSLQAVLTALPLAFALWQMYRKDRLNREVRVMAVTASVCFLGSLALFYSTLDWGRWLHMQYVSLLLILLMTARHAPSFLRGMPVQRIGLFAKVGVPLLTLVYCTCWSLPVTDLIPMRYGYIQTLRVTRHDVMYRMYLNRRYHLRTFGEPPPQSADY